MNGQKINIGQGFSSNEVKQVGKPKESAASISELAAITILEGVVEAKCVKGWVGVHNLLGLVHVVC